MSEGATVPEEVRRGDDAPPAVASQADEAARLRALARYAILDSPADEAFDNLADLAREVTGTSIAGIGFFDERRVWFKSLVGADPDRRFEDDVSSSMAAVVASGEAGFLDRHSQSEDLFSVPLVTSDGFTLGCLLVADQRPFRPDERRVAALSALARQVVHLLELRRTTLSYHTVIDGAGHVVFHLDQADRLVSLTPTWTQLSGFSVVRSLGSQLPAFFHPDERSELEDWLRQVRTSEEPTVAQCRLVRLTQDEVVVEALARPLVDERGRVLGVVGVMADVSERHEREIEAQHVQKLEALGRLAAGLAHEVNTPIQFVGDNVRFLSESYDAMLKLLMTYRQVLHTGAGPRGADAEIRDADAEADMDYLIDEVPSAVQQTLDGVERVASLVRAMKIFSHPGSGAQMPADLNEALRATLMVAQNQFRYIADAELDLQELPPVVCNIGDLNQVFLNIVVNAADAIAEKGEHGTITVSTWTEHDEVVIAVKDTGTGVPEHLKRQIFEPFFTTKTVGHGTGQGLALVRAVVDRHAGSVGLQSEPGLGSTFSIRLPIRGAANQNGSAA